MAENHPCRECKSVAFDRAIICPGLGVIAYNRCLLMWFYRSQC